LFTYHQQTGPVVDYYRKTGIWTPVDAAQSPKLVWGSISTILAGAKDGKAVRQ
jgi:adenylate kinase